MKLGIIRKYSEADFAYIKDRGLDFMEICSNFDNESEDFIAKGDEIKALIEKYEVPVLSVGRWNSEPIKNGAIDRAVVDMLKKQIDVVAKIGCPVFNLGVNREDPEKLSLYKNYVLAVEYLREMLDYAGERGVTLALYNCSWNNFLCESKAWEVILPELPELMIKYDCSHSYARGTNYIAELDRWLDRVAHMHVKGSLIVDHRYVDDPPAGLDALEWSKIFALLYKHGYDKTLSIEPHSATWQGELGERGIDFTVKFVRERMFR